MHHTSFFMGSTMDTTIDWQKVYDGLYRSGFTDGQVAEIGHLSRNVINRVRLGRYKHECHEPGFEGGKALLETLTKCVAEGWIDEDPLTPRAVALEKQPCPSTP